MPKIIENLRARLIEEAGNQVREAGYAALNIRSVAAACCVGVGTVYNYFPSKDDLLAAYMLEDWNQCIDTIQTSGHASESPAPVVRSIYDELRRFSEMHQSIFRDPTAASAFAGASGRYHAMLRSQLAEPLRKFCSDDFTAEFIAESLLTWTVEEKEYEDIHTVISKLFL